MPSPAAALPGWLLDERAGAGRENLDEGHVSRYDRKEDAAAGAEVQYLVDRGMGPGSSVVDLGSGTGQFAIAAAAVCRRVVAADVSPVMLEVLRAKVARAGLSNVDVVEAGFLTYRHEGPAPAVVYSRYALHHLPDAWKALALLRIHDTLRPGGLLRLSDVVYSFEPAEAEERIEAWCATATSQDDSDWTRPELEEHVRDEHSTFSWLLEPMLERVGFEIEEVEHSADGIFARYLLRRPAA